MIELTKMNNEKFFLNPNQVEIVESTPDTLISTISGKKYYVLETVQEVSEMIMQYYVKLTSLSRRIRKVY
jgi:flagellar protein FlbD